MREALIATLVLVMAGAAGAQPVDQKTADRQLFSPRGMHLALASSLGAQDRKIVEAMVREAEKADQDFRYYGSIAFSPSEGLQSESLQGAFNFHSTQAADRAAVATCDAYRKPGSDACIVAAQILPRKYEPRAVQLSHDATSDFQGTYRRIRENKAFAISQTTGAWRIARGKDPAEAAVSACNRAAMAVRGPADCRAVIVD